jgi:hypothetical protein
MNFVLVFAERSFRPESLFAGWSASNTADKTEIFAVHVRLVPYQLHPYAARRISSCNELVTSSSIGRLECLACLLLSTYRGISSFMLGYIAK